MLIFKFLANWVDDYYLIKILSSYTTFYLYNWVDDYYLKVKGDLFI